MRNTPLILHLTMALLLGVSGVSSAEPTSAITPQDRDAVDLEVPLYYGGDMSACQTREGSGQRFNVEGVQENEDAAFHYFVERGLSNEQAAGIVGNFIIESGVNPERKEVGGGPGRGIAQWEASNGSGRWDTLLDYAEDNGTDPWSLQTQLDFTWHELENDPFWGLEGLRNTDTVAEATEVFMSKFERPQDQGQAAVDKRVRAAQPVFERLSGTNPDNYSDASHCKDQGSGGTIVEVAKGELASGIKEADNSHTKYVEGVTNATPDQEWCGYFVSWVLKKAGKPFGEGVDGHVQPAVQGILEYAREHNQFYEADDPDFTPQPGDIAIYKNGVLPWRSHVNIVISYNANNNTYKSIGGNEGGAVKKSENSMESPSLTGFMRPQ